MSGEPEPDVAVEAQIARARLRALGAEYARIARDGDEHRWQRMSVETRTVLLLIAGIESDCDLAVIASRDWREYTDAERAAIRTAGRDLRHQLNRAGDLL